MLKRFRIWLASQIAPEYKPDGYWVYFDTHEISLKGSESLVRIFAANIVGLYGEGDTTAEAHADLDRKAIKLLLPYHNGNDDACITLCKGYWWHRPELELYDPDRYSWSGMPLGTQYFYNSREKTLAGKCESSVMTG